MFDLQQYEKHIRMALFTPPPCFLSRSCNRLGISSKHTFPSAFWILILLCLFCSAVNETPLGWKPALGRECLEDWLLADKSSSDVLFLIFFIIKAHNRDTKFSVSSFQNLVIRADVMIVLPWAINLHCREFGNTPVASSSFHYALPCFYFN